VEGTCELEGAKKWLKVLQRRGEPPVFGIEESAVEGFLLTRGFCQMKDVPMAFLKEVYFEGRNQNRKVSGRGGAIPAKSILALHRFPS
jgi:O-methyltransferase involved in polyketide biosynthesis